MEISPNITDLTRLESNQLEFIRKIAQWGLLPREGEYICPNCAQPMTLVCSARSPDGYRWGCHRSRMIGRKRAKCSIHRSIRTGTFFEKSQLSFRQILGFASLWMDSVKMSVMEKQFRISHTTAVDWASFCREVALCAMMHHQEPIGGVGKIVEIDESKFTRRKHNVGRVTPDYWVFGGIERGSGKVFMVPMQDRAQKTLIDLVNKWILPGTKIISDCWKSYSSLRNEGYEHETVNHSFHFVDPNTGVHTQTIEASWRAPKVTITPANRKANSMAGNLARFMLLKKAKFDGVDPVLLFYRMAGQLYNPLVEREVEIRRPGEVLPDDDEEEEVEEEEEEEEN